MSRLRIGGLTVLLTSGACQYEFDALYEFPVTDPLPMNGDAGMGEDAAMPRSTHLIGLWGNYPTVDEECIRCAETACAQVDEACRADPECVAFTRCVAESPTPAGQMACRTRHLEWVTSGDVLLRDLNGPYGQCVFRDACVTECEGASDFACLHNYTWPMTAEQSVPLHLIVNDSQDLKRTLAGVTVKVCTEGDTLCSAPGPTGVTDERGYIRLDLPTSFTRSFTGYLELQGAGVYPTLLKFSWNIGGPTEQLVTLVNKTTYDFYATDWLKVTLDADRGMLQTRMLGCSAITTRGVSFATTGADTQTRHWYLDNAIPSFTARETNVLGAGGTFNLLPGYQTVTATRAVDGVLVGRTNAPVRPGFMTIVIFQPLPQ